MGWEKERLERTLKAEIDFYEGRIKDAFTNPTDPRKPMWEKRLADAKEHLEQVERQPACSEEAPAPSTPEPTSVPPLPALPPSP